MLRLERRASPSRLMGWLAPLLALGATLGASVVLFLALGVSLGEAFHAFFVDPVSSRYGLAELGVKAAPLVMIGVALSIGFRAQVWNIGAEGQLIVGAIAGGAVALALVVFAVWQPGRVLLGAYLFGGIGVLQLHGQALGLAVPSQLMSMLPYLVTILVLVLISRDAGRIRRNAPASIGKAFHPTI